MFIDIPRYMNLGYSKKSHDCFNNLKERVKLHGGKFTMLWHNSHFEKKVDKIFYLKAISK
jgi:hypothetical protein